MTSHHDRHVAIVLYGFEADPAAIANQVGYADVAILRVGDTVGRQTSKKNRLTWRSPIYNDEPWDAGVETLLSALGGAEQLKDLLEKTQPEAAWLRLCLPTVGSPHQESGGLGSATIRQLAFLGLDFDIAAFDYDPANPTHGLKTKG